MKRRQKIDDDGPSRCRTKHAAVVRVESLLFLEEGIELRSHRFGRALFAAVAIDEVHLVGVAAARGDQGGDGPDFGIAVAAISRKQISGCANPCEEVHRDVSAAAKMRNRHEVDGGPAFLVQQSRGLESFENQVSPGIAREEKGQAGQSRRVGFVTWRLLAPRRPDCTRRSHSGAIVRARSYG